MCSARKIIASSIKVTSNGNVPFNVAGMLIQTCGFIYVSTRLQLPANAGTAPLSGSRIRVYAALRHNSLWLFTHLSQDILSS